MPPPEYFLAMLLGYLLTIAIETAVLVALLSRRHSMRVKVFAGIWLSACTYPVVWLVFPGMFSERWVVLLFAETFAPVAECALFWFAFIRRLPSDQRATIRDLAVITLANLCSFGFGEVFDHFGGFDFILGEPGG